jgi:hypothetical protein
MKHILAVIALVAVTYPAQAQQPIAQHAVIKPLAVLPPVEYDRPYTGTLVTTRTQDQAQTRYLCQPIPFPLALGCAYRFPTGCWVIISPDNVIAAAGLSFDIVTRHEIAHCNGWPPDHRGARELPR